MVEGRRVPLCGGQPPRLPAVRPRGGLDCGDRFQGDLTAPQGGLRGRGGSASLLLLPAAGSQGTGHCRAFQPALRAGARPNLRGALTAAGSQGHREGPGTDRAAEGAESRGGSTLHHRGPHPRQRPQGDGPDLEAPPPPGLDGHPSRRLLPAQHQTDWDEESLWRTYTTLTSRSALCGRIPEVLAGPDRLAIGRLQVPCSRPLDRVAPARAVPAVAADCQQHPPAGVDPAGGDPELGHLGDGGQFAAPQRRLAGDLRPSAGVGRGLRRPQAVRRHPVCGRKLEVGRAHPRVLAAATAATPSPTATSRRCTSIPSGEGPENACALDSRASAGSHSARIRSLRRRSRCRRCCKSSPPSRITADPRAASSSCRPCWRSGNWRVCPATAASTPLGAMPAL